MDQATPSAAPISKRPRKWLRRLALVLLFFVLVIGVVVLFFLRAASSELNDVIAEMDRLDPGWRLEDIEAGRKVVPDDKNSALHIMTVKKLLGGKAVQTPAMEKTFRALPPQVEHNAEQTAELQKRFALFPKAVLEARKLIDLPEGRWPINYEANLFSKAPAVRLMDALDVCRLLELDAARRVQAFDADGAVDSCLAAQHAAQSMGNDPTLMAQLVRHACTAVAMRALERTLAQGHFTDASEPTLKRMQAALAKELPQQTLLPAMRAERAFAHQVFEAIAEGKVSAANLAAARAAAPIADTLEMTMIDRVPGYRTRQHAAQLRIYNDVIEALKLPPQTREDRLQVLLKKAKDGSLLVRTSMPYLLGLVKEACRPQAQLRCALVALAAERFRLGQKRWPASLQELLEANLLDAVPTGPYDGKPMRLKRIADGLIIYCTGPDGIDHGGVIGRDANKPGTDLGFQVWDVAQRRQSPRPSVVK
jgi:hypothetical protein